MPIGPALPPHLAHLAASAGGVSRNDGPDDDEENDFGPALPPHLAAQRRAGPSRPSQPAPSSDEDDEDDFGPALPSHLSNRRLLKNIAPPAAGPSRSSARASYADESSDDEIGPKPDHAPSVRKTAAEEFLEREERREKAKAEAESGPKKPQRQEWMLVPPTTGVLAAVDPLRKRPTTFNRSSRAGDIDSSAWTETPAERAQREQDELAGVTRAPNDSRPKTVEAIEDGRKRRRDAEIAEEVRRHNDDHRGASLMEQHAKKPKKTDEAEVIWDREKMLGVGGKFLSDHERAQKIKDARGLNDRFGHSTQGAYSH